MKEVKRAVLTFVVLFVIFCVFNFASARRVADFGSTADILQQVGRKLAFTTEQLEKGNMTNQVAADDYLEMINLLQSLYHQGLNYSQFKSVLENMNNAVFAYYGCVYYYYKNGLIEVGEREQMILGSVALDMSELLKKAPAYIRGKASDTLKYAIPLLSDSPKVSAVKNELKDILFSLTEDSDYLSRFYAVKSLGQLAKSSFNSAEQDEIVEKISGLIDDKDMLVIGSVVQTLGNVLSSVEINHLLYDEIISDLMNLYAQPLHYPVSNYLADCLKVLAGDEPDKWREPLTEILGRYHPIDRKSTLNYIFGDEKY